MSAGAENEERFNVTVGEFKGSLDTLLLMVQRRKMHISEISLADVTDEYLAYIDMAGHTSRHHSVEFIVVASTLLLIKSKALLPDIELSVEEEDSIEELERRLELYKIYKKAQGYLRMCLINTTKLLSPLKFTNVSPQSIKIKENSLTPAILHNTIRSIILTFPNHHYLEETTITNTINIKYAMQSLLDRVNEERVTILDDIIGTNKEDKIINFLALLELVRIGKILAERDIERSKILIKQFNIVT